MSKEKIILNLILLSVIALLLMAVFGSQSKTENKELTTGYIDLTNISSNALYEKTILRTYESEPSWKPEKVLGTSIQPEIAGKAGYLVELNTQTVLFEHNSTQKRKIASLAKIMTAVVALEHKELNEKIHVTQEADSIGENSMGISAGEIYTLEELLYGLVLHSGNDAAYAIAQGVAGDVDVFTDWMNIKAKKLGLSNTHFTDPSGLDDSTYSTTEDLVKLARYALKNPEFKRIVGTLEIELTGENHKYIYLYNQTNLLSTYPGVAGIKTGFTEEAGLTLVTYAKNEDVELVGVVLGSVDRKGDMILMLDHGFLEMGVRVEHNLL